MPPVLFHTNHAFDRHYEMAFQAQQILKDNLAVLEKKTEELEEDYYIGKKVPPDTYDRLRNKLAVEKKGILDSLANLDIESSNWKEYFHWAVTISSKLNTAWASSAVATKEKIQKMVFPEGICYNHEKAAFPTGKVNEVFAAIPLLNCISDDDKNKQGGIATTLSSLVGTTGLAPLIQVALLLTQETQPRLRRVGFVFPSA